MTGIIQGLLASIGSAVASAASDAYFNLVTLLLNTSSTNGAQNNTFLDSSTNNFTVTRNGNTTQGTFTPFSQTGWGNYFNGSSYLQNSTSAPLATTASTFTIEAWVYMTAAPTNGTSNRVSVIADANPTGSTMYWGFGVNSSQQISFFWYASGDNSVTGNTTISLNAWHHIAMSVSSNAISMYVDGVQQTLSGTTTLTNRSGTTFGDTGVAFELGYWNNATAVFTGYMSNVRIVSGTAVYSGSSFTPPTTPLTAISGTSVLTCQSNRFVDNSTNAYPFTIGGTPSVQAFSPFAPTAAYDTAVVGGSGYFDGSGDYLTVPDNAVYDLSGDFTLELWAYMNDFASSGAAPSFISGTNSSNNWLFFVTASNEVIFMFNTGIVINGTATSTVKEWAHYALCRSGSTLRVFKNGVLLTSVTNSTNFTISNSVLYFGVQNGSNGFINGYMSGLRLVNGTALYTAAFTPPTAPPTAITNTALLLNFTNAGIYDSASKNVLETVGNAQVSTTQAKWGTTSMYFDGTGDNLILPNSPICDFGTGDFTIEGWVYIVALSGSAQGTFIGRGINSGASFHIAVSTGGTWLYYLSSNNSSWNIASAVSMGAATVGAWQHIALVRNGTTFTPYLNGVAGTTTTNSSAIYWNSGTSSVNQITVGGSEAVPPLQVLNGYIDDLRISKFARYTASFTPPSSAFATQ